MMCVGGNFSRHTGYVWNEMSNYTNRKIIKSWGLIIPQDLIDHLEVRGLVPEKLSNLLLVTWLVISSAATRE